MESREYVVGEAVLQDDLVKISYGGVNKGLGVTVKSWRCPPVEYLQPGTVVRVYYLTPATVSYIKLAQAGELAQVEEPGS